ncbi:hypothetical protein GGR56DRAFT_279156 [Xylariaceae sp. FL0804]|nr:hypothetical protein GGR56DRAFT_279156 [Xylariaceae sp. FL0804]
MSSPDSHGQAQNVADEQKAPNLGVVPQVDAATAVDTSGAAAGAADGAGAGADVDDAVKDRIDGAVPLGPKKADASTGGRVEVAETGDLHDLAAHRQQAYHDTQEEEETKS